MSLCHRNRASLAFSFAALLLLGAGPLPMPSHATPPEGLASPDARYLPPPAVPARAPDAEDSTITAMVDAVDGDEIYAFLEKLTGEVAVEFDYGSRHIHTRYSEAEGSVKAAAPGGSRPGVFGSPHHTLAEVREGSCRAFSSPSLRL